MSPLVYGRTDLKKYSRGAKVLENFLPMKYGPIEREPGFECFVDGAATPVVVSTKGDAVCRLERFRFNTSTNYVLGFTNLALRFYKGGITATQIESSPGTAYEVVTPYLEADLFALQVRQINDVMYITHPDYAVRKLSRFGETNWTLTEVDWDFPPLLDLNATSTTVTPSGTTGTINLPASGSIYTAEMEGGYLAITHTREAQKIDYKDTDLGANISEGTDTVKVKGPWTFTTGGFWDGIATLSKREVGTSAWTEVWSSTSDMNAAGEGGANFAISGNETLDDYEYTIAFSFDTQSPKGASWNFVTEPVDITGFVQLGTYVSGTSFTGCTVKKTLEANTATKFWNEGAFSDRRGHPRTCTFHQQRLWFASTSHEKQRIWASQTADFENFETGANDDDGLAIDLASDQQNEILWLRSEKRILIGTSANEWTISADNLNGAITPSNITAKLHTFVGSKELPSVMSGNKFLFLSRNSRRLQSFFYNFQVDGYDSDEVSKLSEHITEGGIVQMSYQQVRDQIVWMVRGDGEFANCVFNEEDDVIAFWRRNNPAIEFESVATIYGDDEDEVWAVGKMTVNGSTKRFIMRRSARQAAKEDKNFLDASLSYSGSSSTTWSGFDHLEGESVDVLADGWVANGLTVNSGEITLPTAASKVIVGKPYTSTYRSLNIEAPTGDGSSKGKKKRITRIDLGLKDSLGGEYGIVKVDAPNNQNVEDVFEKFDRITGVSLIGGSPDLVTGVFPLTMPPGNYEELDLIVRQSDPLPMQITHTFPSVNTKGD